MNYSKSDVVDATGKMIMEFDSKDLDSIIVSADVDIFWGFEDLSQTIFPLLAYSTLSITNQDFRNPVLAKIYSKIIRFLGLQEQFSFAPDSKIVRIFAKRQVAGNANIYLSYLGGNL